MRTFLLLVVLGNLDVALPHAAPTEDAWPELKRLARELDVWDNDSAWGRAEASWGDEVRWTRDRWQEVRDCPPSSDATRLGGPDFCRAVMNRACEYQSHLYLVRDSWPPSLQDDALSARLIDANCRRYFWDRAAAASCLVNPPYIRRQALDECRQLVGHEAYYAGQWPQPAP